MYHSQDGAEVLHCQRIDQIGPVAGADLHQAEARLITPLPYELRIKTHPLDLCILLVERIQCRLALYQRKSFHIFAIYKAVKVWVCFGLSHF